MKQVLFSFISSLGVHKFFSLFFFSNPLSTFLDILPKIHPESELHVQKCFLSINVLVLYIKKLSSKTIKPSLLCLILRQSLVFLANQSTRSFSGYIMLTAGNLGAWVNVSWRNHVFIFIL